jgi:deoxyribodipyrimidine photo-lyase
MTPTLVWFERDLRVQDNPALHAAMARGGAIIPVFVWDDLLARGRLEGGQGVGAAARWWLHASLRSLDDELRQRGSRLILLRGAAVVALPDLAKATGAGAVFWNRRYEPALRARDDGVKAAFAEVGLEAKCCTGGSLLNEPDAIRNRQGRPFQVFTAYWRQCLTIPPSVPFKLSLGPLPSPVRWPRSVELDELALRPRIAWDAGLQKQWTPGEPDAVRRLTRFVAGPMDRYDEDRDLPADDGTSTLSPSLHFGEISARQIWAAVKARSKTSGVFPPSNGARVFLSEIGWREFAHHLLFHFPETTQKPLREAFARFPWAPDPGGTKLRAWQQGNTGYPIVDAGMRQLWQTGWMHNRVRMIVASFLVKHLRLPWTAGLAWFDDTLVDADLANNALGWQWSAGCGADAAPYFRIFAPVLQGQKFDRDGRYVRRWVPELAQLPDKHVHAPWGAPPAVLAAAGVRLGENYPRPIVDHATARAEALAAFRSLHAGPSS